MTVTYPLRPFFDCSTAHLSPSTRSWLEASVAAGERMIAPTPFGWFLWCGEEQVEPEMPADLAHVLRHAAALGAEYILFDADAPSSPDLPSFEDAP